MFQERTKHIEANCPFVHEKIQQGLLFTANIRTGELLLDIFTKALNGNRVYYICDKYGRLTYMPQLEGCGIQQLLPLMRDLVIIALY